MTAPSGMSGAVISQRCVRIRLSQLFGPFSRTLGRVDLANRQSPRGSPRDCL
jgi:hypothetical protein